MDEHIVEAIIKRWGILIANAKPNEIGLGMTGSRVLFNSALALIGCPFSDPPEWMDEEYLKPIMSQDEFQSDTYDNLLHALHELAYRKVNDDNEETQTEVELCLTNPLKYLEMFEQRKNIEAEEYHKQFKEWMTEFPDDPKPTREQIEEQIKNQASRVKRLHELRVPSKIIEAEQDVLGKLMTDLREGNWALTEAEIKYTNDWYARMDAFEYKQQLQ